MNEAASKSKAKVVPPFAAAPAAPAVTAIEQAAPVLRDVTDRGVAQATENMEHAKAAAQAATGKVEQTFATASKGAAEYGQKVLEISRANTNAAFDFATKLMTAKSLAEMVELSTAHARSQFEVSSTQGRELMGLAQKITTDSVEPLKAGMADLMKKPV